MRSAVVAAVVLIVSSLAVPAEAAPIPCGTTLRHSVRLRTDVGTDLVPCSGNGLVIARSGVTVDLRNHSIWGTGTGDGIQILPAVQRVKILRGTIRDFATGNGVHAESGNSRLVVRDVRTVANFNGMVLNGNRVKVSRAVSAWQGGVGIAITGAHASVTLSTVTQNVSGITITGPKANVAHNVVASNTAKGIVIGGGHIGGNTVTGNGSDAITFGGPSTIVGNAVVGNTGQGIGGTGNGTRIVRNRIVGNGNYGIDVDSERAVYDHNVVDGNDWDGMFVSGGFETRISHNTIRGNANFGMDLSGPSISVVANDVRGNDHAGIHWAIGGGVLENNTLVGNGFGTGGINGIQSGIDATGATVTGSNNDAEANDDYECIPMSICTHHGTSITNGPTLACGAHVTTSVKLSADVGSEATPCAGGLVVDDDNVTIDLNGHTIWGNGATATPPIVGIDIGSHEGVHVLNGRVVDFQIGVFRGTPGMTTGRGAGPQIDGLVIGQIHHSMDNALLIDGKTPVISSDALVAVSQRALELEETGTVVGNVVVGGGGGLGVDFATSVSRNLVRYVTGTGIVAINAPIGSNVVVHSEGAGITASAGPVAGNEVVASGVPATGPSVPAEGIDGGKVVANNIVTRSTDFAVHTDQRDAVVSGNLIAANKSTGGFFSADRQAIIGNRSFGNVHGIRINGGSGQTLRSNTLIGNSSFGIEVSAPTTVTLKRNAVIANGDEGVRSVVTATAVVIRNMANANGFAHADESGLGLDISGPTHGHNKAAGNDDPAECHPTTIC